MIGFYLYIYIFLFIIIFPSRVVGTQQRTRHGGGGGSRRGGRYGCHSVGPVALVTDPPAGGVHTHTYTQLHIAHRTTVERAVCIVYSRRCRQQHQLQQRQQEYRDRERERDENGRKAGLLMVSFTIRNTPNFHTIYCWYWIIHYSFNQPFCKITFFNKK